MLDKIRDILEEYVELPKGQITKETNLLSDLGLNSLEIVNLVVDFENEFEIKIPDRKLLELLTVGDIIRMLQDEYKISK